jgi:hypothetical protein
LVSVATFIVLTEKNMKKLIGVIVILLTLILSVLYRQLAHRPAKEKSEQAHVPASLRDGMILSYLLLQ